MSTVSNIGRRKTSIARIYMSDGKGDIIINNKKLEDYFPFETQRYIVTQPFTLLDKNGSYDVKVNVKGGGPNGQAEAIRLAIVRALTGLDDENRPVLKKEGLTTRDPRMVERKKYGRRKARRRFQFSKR